MVVMSVKQHHVSTQNHHDKEFEPTQHGGPPHLCTYLSVPELQQKKINEINRGIGQSISG